MIVPVILCAIHNKGWNAGVGVRMVEIPNNEWSAVQDNKLAKLNLVYHYGQNDIQNEEGCRSLMAGDVIDLYGEFVLICGIGFKMLTHEEYKALIEMSVQDRQFKVLSTVC